MLSFDKRADGAVSLKATGQITKADIDHFEPQFDRIAAEEGPVRMIIELDDFNGWSFDGFWRDLKFDSRHHDDLDRVAIIGDEDWQEWGAKLSDPFYKAEMRFFNKSQREKAESWIRQ